ncbi:3-alpha-hydroxysteroid dehydrogenase [Streptomyces chrestomyceticus JCM 4735]|uniref:3-alpha-hydroxysteroid dehydrogenase n=1 Tax=Streptomyces chrestomyceticus JCM 4735 TaxID=1306181 RepID=A0A7U9KX07_9ACTN|nr:SDR family NAD(P)-dependent oxidoreductase [Streptomyces chrestomyceticus]GCD36949.1 3-alpha-hydroxysteroid dehydrogenase [Streptomyces chrestomyceticus JCM 4735]
MGKLDGRVVIITGAARGQGEQEARLFVAEGARVVLGDVLDGPGEALAAELGDGRARYVHLDVRREVDWEAAVRAAGETFGTVDGLVNNAGILRFNELAATPLAEFQEVVQVNQVGTFLGMRAVIPELTAAGGGTVVNTASYAALSGMAYLTAYAASKAAVVGMTRVAAMELAGRGIRVNAMCPGAVDTPMTRPERGPAEAAGVPDASTASAPDLDAFYAKTVPLGRIGRPEEVARLALFLSCADSSYITGQPFVIDGGRLSGISLY